MRIYFTACTPAALKLDGQYCGTIDNFERYAEVGTGGAFAEIVPEGGLLPINFFTGGNFLLSPPENVAVYNIFGGTWLRVRRFFAQRGRIRVISQRVLGGSAFTLFCWGGVYAATEGARGGIFAMPEGFEAQFEEVIIGGERFLCLRDGRHIALFSADGGLCMLTECSGAKFGERPVICTAAEDSAQSLIFTAYGYDGREFVRESVRTEESKAPCAQAPHLAFFDCVLRRGDCTQYLSAELKAKAGELHSYLGDFCEVLVPDELFFERYGDVAAAGLAYQKSANTCDVKYFICELDCGVIRNIYPAE